MMADGDEEARFNAKAWDEAMEDLDSVLDRKMGYVGDEDDRVRWEEEDFELNEAHQNGGY